MARGDADMEPERLNALENFAAVWRRVRGEEAPPPAAENGTAAMLRGHMDALAASSAYLYALAGRCPGAVRGELSRLAAGEKKRFRSLLLEYFLLTGAAYSPAGSCPVREGFAQGLRAAYLAAQTEESRLRADAESCAGELRETLLTAAEGEARSACALRALLKRRIVGF